MQNILNAIVPKAYAQVNLGSICSKGGAFASLCSRGNNGDIGSVLGPVVNLLFFIAAIIALFFLIIGGIRWVTSSGEEKNVEGARNQIIAAAIGLGVTFLSYLIINLLLNFFLGTGIQKLTLPGLTQ